MKLADMTVTQFVDTVASDAPAPGGGSAAALQGAIGTALTAMVAQLTCGRGKYAAYAAFAAQAQTQALALKAQLADVMDRDTAAFCAVSDAFAMPKDTDAQRTARSAAIQEGLKACIRTPMEMMTLCEASIALTAALQAHGFNDSAASDLGVAFLSLSAAMRGAWLNVLINIGSLKDRDFAAQCRSAGEALLARALPAAEDGYAQILASLGG